MKHKECETCIHRKVCWTVEEFGERLDDGLCEDFVDEHRPHGEWKRIELTFVGYTYRCSECGWKIKATDRDIDLHYHFCSNCGADMRGEAE